MTIYVDDFHTVRASEIDGVRYANMIGSDHGELVGFARKISANWRDSGCCIVTERQAKLAVLLGAVPVTAATLHAMRSLRFMGEDMEPAGDAGARRDRIARWSREMA